LHVLPSKIEMRVTISTFRIECRYRKYI